MTLASQIIQILHKQEVGSLDFDLLNKKIERILQLQFEANQFISLVETIEDRADPQSKYYDESVNRILEQFGVTRATFYRKRAKYENQGIQGLIPKKPGPKGSRLPPRIQDRIESLRDLKLSARSISSMISLETQKHLPESTTQYFLKSIHRGKLPRNRKKKEYYTSFECSRPNELWQIDNVGPFYKPTKLYAYNIVDDHSRSSLGVVIADNQESISWLHTLEKLVEKYGVPEAILHDNGSQFVVAITGKLTKNFGKFITKYGIRKKGLMSFLKIDLSPFLTHYECNLKLSLSSQILISIPSEAPDKIHGYFLL